MNNGLKYESKTNYSGEPDFVAYPSAPELFGNSSTSIGSTVLSKLPDYAAQVAAANGNVTKASDLESFFKIQWDFIFQDNMPVAEILVEPSGYVYDTEYWASVPFSRGSIHIQSADPTAKAHIDPKYFMLDFDLQAQVQVARFIRDLFKTEPLADTAGAETSPGYSNVASNATDSEWSPFILGNCTFSTYSNLMSMYW